MSDPTPEQVAKTRPWLQSEAGKDLSETQAYVLARANELFEAINAIPKPNLSEPCDGEWSPIDAMKHAVEWNWQAGEDVLHVSLMGTRPANPAPVSYPTAKPSSRANASRSIRYGNTSAPPTRSRFSI